MTFAFDEVYVCQDCGAECVGLRTWETCTHCNIRRHEKRMATAREGRAYSIVELGGACPTQAVGRTAGGRPYYFRARGGYWKLKVGEPEFPTDYPGWPRGRYDDQFTVADGEDLSDGWMEDNEVLAILDEHLKDR